MDCLNCGAKERFAIRKDKIITFTFECGEVMTCEILESKAPHKLAYELFMDEYNSKPEYYTVEQKNYAENRFYSNRDRGDGAYIKLVPYTIEVEKAMTRERNRVEKAQKEEYERKRDEERYGRCSWSD